MIEVSFDDFIARFPSDVKENTKLARELFFKLFSHIDELIDEGNSTIKYGFGKGSNNLLCTLIPTENNLTIEFYKGNELNDPERNLINCGKGNKLMIVKDFYNQQHYLKFLLKEAFKMWQMR